MRFFLTALLAALIVLPVHTGQAALPVDTTVIDKKLYRVGHAVREKGSTDLYSVGLYMPNWALVNLDTLGQAKWPKRFIVEILYDGARSGRVPDDWQAELSPALKTSQSRALERAYKNLRPGDRIEISYNPDKGSWVTVNGDTVLREKGHRLMDRYIDIWVGRDAVSSSVKSGLLGR